MGQTTPSLNIDWYDVPVIGEWVGKVGRVKRMVAQPCDPGAYIAVLAMWHALPGMIWSLVGPDCIDLVDDRRGRPHRRRRGIRWSDGHYIRGEPPISGFGWRIFRLGDLVQKVGWYWGLVDATADFAVNWMSLGMIFTGCKGAGNPYAHLQSFSPGQALLFTGAWVPLTWPVVDDHIFIAGGAAVGIPHGYTYASLINADIHQFPGIDPPSSFEVRIRDLASDSTIWEGKGDPIDDQGGLGVGGYADRHLLNPATTLQSEYRSETPGLFTGSWTVTGIYVGEAGGIAPFGCGTLTEGEGSPEKFWADWVDQ